MIDAGMEQIFNKPNSDDSKNQLLIQLRSCMVENRAVIDQVFLRFVFMGDPAKADKNEVLMRLKEELENQGYRLNDFFGGRSVPLLVDFRSADGKAGVPP